MQFYGPEGIKPNNHWGVHLPNQLRDFGPVYAFWTFLGERLNKLLKTFNNNSRKGGQLEVSMMRSFGRDVQLQHMVRFFTMALLRYIVLTLYKMREISFMESMADSHEVESVVFKRLLDESAEARGTVADAAKQNYSVVAGELI